MTDNKLGAVAYFAVGGTSENGNAERDMSDRRSLASIVRSGLEQPVPEH